MSVLRVNVMITWLGLAGVLLAVGCTPTTTPQTTKPPVPPKPAEQIQQVMISATPYALNLDGQGGPDGVGVRVFFQQPGSDAPATVEGRLEFQLYLNVVDQAQLAQSRCFYAWTYQGEELKPHLRYGIWGFGYAFELNWGPNVPPAQAVTIVARYTQPNGRTVVSAPVSIGMGRQ